MSEPLSSKERVARFEPLLNGTAFMGMARINCDKPEWGGDGPWVRLIDYERLSQRENHGALIAELTNQLQAKADEITTLRLQIETLNGVYSFECAQVRRLQRQLESLKRYCGPWAGGWSADEEKGEPT